MSDFNPIQVPMAAIVNAALRAFDERKFNEVRGFLLLMQDAFEHVRDSKGPTQPASIPNEAT